MVFQGSGIGNCQMMNSSNRSTKIAMSNEIMTPTESETNLQAKGECDHIWGHDDEDGRYLYENQLAIYSEDELSDYVTLFDFCPKCGKSLTP